MPNLEGSPLEVFDQRTKDLTDFNQFLKVLAQVGVPALLQTESLQDSDQERRRRKTFHIGFVTLRVLSNRRQEGLQNNIMDLFGDPTSIRAVMSEFITDEEFNEIEHNDCPGIVWEKQEEFMFALCKIPNSKIRLTIWNFINKFPEEFEHLEQPVKFLKLVIKI